MDESAGEPRTAFNLMNTLHGESFCGWIVQRMEDHPHNPGWWRYSRPYWVATEAALPAHGFPDTVRWNWGSRDELAAAQAEWDRSNPRG